VDVFRALESTSSCRASPRSVMEHILQCDSGVYIVQPIDENGNSPHAIAINCFNRTIHDCAEEFAMVLSIGSISHCCTAGNNCIGFLAAYRLEMKSKKHSRNRRSIK
jgi:ankyrin repeat protein